MEQLKDGDMHQCVLKDFLQQAQWDVEISADFIPERQVLQSLMLHDVVGGPLYKFLTHWCDMCSNDCYICFLHINAV